MSQTPSRIHPLLATAAGSVILVSLLGVAAITGILPTSHSTPPASPNTLNATPLGLNGAPAMSNNFGAAPVAIAESNPAPVVHKARNTDNNTSHTASQNSARHTPPAVNKPAQIANKSCDNCGTVLAVNAIKQPAPETSGVGAVVGGVLGGVLGNQVGGGNGKKIATVAGAIGGGLAGNEIEKRSKASTTYEIKVKMEDGSVRSFSQTSEPGWHSGDRVRVENGQLSTRA